MLPPEAAEAALAAVIDETADVVWAVAAPAHALEAAEAAGMAEVAAGAALAVAVAVALAGASEAVGAAAVRVAVSLAKAASDRASPARAKGMSPVACAGADTAASCTVRDDTVVFTVGATAGRPEVAPTAGCRAAAGAFAGAGEATAGPVASLGAGAVSCAATTVEDVGTGAVRGELSATKPRFAASRAGASAPGWDVRAAVGAGAESGVVLVETGSDERAVADGMAPAFDAAVLGEATLADRAVAIAETGRAAVWGEATLPVGASEAAGSGAETAGPWVERAAKDPGERSCSEGRAEVTTASWAGCPLPFNLGRSAMGSGAGTGAT
jgi:hypothetical protein